MYSATSMLSKARSNPVYGEIRDNSNRRNYYRNVYLKSEHWKNLRKEKLEKTPFCEKCKTTLSLDIHHKEYRELFDVRIGDLQTLCRVCHEKEHKNKDIKKEKKRYKRDSKYRKFLEECNDYDNFMYIFHNKKPNYFLIKCILKHILYYISSDTKPKHLSKFNKSKQEKFDRDKQYKESLRELNNYVSIHY